MRNIFFIIFLFFTYNFFAQETGFIPYKLYKKWIVLNDSCQIISKEKYDTVCLMSGGLARVKQKNKWGYLNKKCEIVIPIIYKSIGLFDEGSLACVQLKNKWGFVNKKNEIVIPIVYDSIGRFLTAEIPCICVKKNDSIFYIDRKGNRITIEKARPFGVCGTQGGLTLYFNGQEIKGKNGYGLLHNEYGMTEEQWKHPDTLVPCIYKKIISSSESSMAILLNSNYSLYDTRSKKMLVTDCDTMFFYGKYNTPFWVVFTKKNLNGFASPNGETTLRAQFKFLKIINTNFIYITDDKNQSYYINYKGKKFIPKQN